MPVPENVPTSAHVQDKYGSWNCTVSVPENVSTSANTQDKIWQMELYCVSP